MATFLDTIVLEKFYLVFSWLLIFVVVFGAAEVTNIFKNRALHALLAFAFAMIAGFSPSVLKVLSNFAPWVLILAFFFLFVIMITGMLGISMPQLVEGMGGKGAIWWVLVPFIIALIWSLSTVFGQGMLEERVSEECTTLEGEAQDQCIEDSSHKQSVILTLTNPKVLGMMLIFLIGMFTVIFLTGTPALPKP